MRTKELRSSEQIAILKSPHRFMTEEKIKTRSIQKEEVPSKRRGLRASVCESSQRNWRPGPTILSPNSSLFGAKYLLWPS